MYETLRAENIDKWLSFTKNKILKELIIYKNYALKRIFLVFMKIFH